MDSDDSYNPTASEGELFVAQIVQELEMEKTNNAQKFLDNLPEFGLEVSSDMMQQDLGNIPCFQDVPSILVDDNNSVCYPCIMVEDQQTDSLSEDLEKETNEKKKSEKSKTPFMAYAGWKWYF